MKSTDRLLLAIVIGAVILAVTAFFFVFNIPEAQYQSEETPEGVAHNYLLALQEKDYQRAYDYLSSELSNYPKDVAEFKNELGRYNGNYRQGNSVSLSILDTNITGTGNTAFIEVRENTFYQGDFIFGSQYTNHFEMTLTFMNGEWKISNSESYFSFCWNQVGESGPCSF